MRITKHFARTSVNPAWIVLDIISILPPELRHLLHIGNGKLISSDLNELYRRLVRRNRRFLF